MPGVVSEEAVWMVTSIVSEQSINLYEGKQTFKYWGLELVPTDGEVEVSCLIDSLSLSVFFYTPSFDFPPCHLLTSTSIFLALRSQRCRGTFSILDMAQRRIWEQRPWFYIKRLATCAKYLHAHKAASSLCDTPSLRGSRCSLSIPSSCLETCRHAEPGTRC